MRFISPPALSEAQGLCFAAAFLIFKILFCDFCQASYLNIYGTDLHEICWIGTPLTVDEDLELLFRSRKGRRRGNQFCGKNRPPIHTL